MACRLLYQKKKKKKKKKKKRKKIQVSEKSANNIVNKSLFLSFLLDLASVACGAIVPQDPMTSNGPITKT